MKLSKKVERLEKNLGVTIYPKGQGHIGKYGAAECIEALHNLIQEQELRFNKFISAIGYEEFHEPSKDGFRKKKQ